MATGRYAPSPTGTFHLGNLRTALAAYLFARREGSRFVLRWEDLDVTAAPEHAAGQRRDLELLGIEFDGPALRQSDRLDDYRDAIADLTRAGLTYPCWCSRREIREAVAAPHGRPGTYPGTCRALTAAQTSRRRETGRPPALRLRADAASVTIVDRLAGPSTATVDDFVLARGDGTPAYNLVVVLDDAFQGIEEVVRGDDLLESTHRHAHLQAVLGIPEPAWAHVPLVLDHTGARLAKRDGSAGLDRWRRAGGTIDGLRAAFGRTLGIDTGTTATIDELLAGFDPDRIPPGPAVVSRSGAELSLSR